MKGKYFRSAIFCILLIYCIIAVARMFFHQNEYQWDFKIYYYAAKVYAEALNPYDTAVVSHSAGEALNSYNQPPFTLFIFMPFSLLSYSTAYCCFLFLKCIMVGGLLYVWRTYFLDKEIDTMFCLILLFGFRSALYLDIRAGNINMLEQLAVWLAFLCYLRRRLVPFCVLIFGGATLKILTVVFLGLLLISKDGKKYKYLFISLLILVMIFIISYMADPYMFNSFVSNAFTKMQDERGLHQPSTLALLRDGIKVLHPGIGLQALTTASTVLYAMVCIVVLVMTSRALNILMSGRFRDGDKVMIFLACFAYALVMPRFKDYYYIQLLVPTYYIIRYARSVKSYIPFFVLVILFSILSPESPLPGFKRLNNLMTLFWEYYPLALAFGGWLLYLYEIDSTAREKPENSVL